MWLLYCVQDLLLGVYFAALDGDLNLWLQLPAAFQPTVELVAVVELRVCLSSCRVHTRPTTVMRILTNLVNNALQQARCAMG